MDLKILMFMSLKCHSSEENDCGNILSRKNNLPKYFILSTKLIFGIENMILALSLEILKTSNLFFALINLVIGLSYQVELSYFLLISRFHDLKSVFCFTLLN